MSVNLVVLVLLASFGCIVNECHAKSDSDVFYQQVPCTYHSDCAGRWNLCSRKIGDQLFCQCKEGSSGENCTLVDQCLEGVVDCGSNNNASCLLGDEGKAYCQCDDEYQGYIEKSKTCRDCDCGDKSVVYGCKFGVDGKKKCDCDFEYYQNDEGKCVDCACGDFGVITCKLEKGVKTCKCFDGYVSNRTYCIDCECGGNAKCSIQDDKTVCTCKEGYLPSGPNSRCLLQCNASNPCENGGTCSEGVCLCRNGTGGNLCREVADCRAGWTCGEADCLYDIYAEKAYCKCRDPDLTFEDHEKRCRRCDCGSHSKSCKFSYTFKKCACEDLYDDWGGTCTSCSCKGYTSSCRFDRQGTKICECAPGYSQSKDECKECDCGYEGVCEFDEYFNEKTCKCNKGYESDGEKCLRCDCGDNGTCALYGFYEARCSCHEGFQVYQGKCQTCDCGENAECSFSSTGETQCECVAGYGMKAQVCTACGCGVGGNCSFDESHNGTTKHCVCLEGLSDDGGTCRECDCQLEGSNCTFVEGLRTCRCPQGFSQATNSSNQLTFCQDVDECLDSGSCPKSATCVNTIGSYECVCGDEKATSLRDVKSEGCPTGGLGSWAIAGIVAGCIFGALVIFGGIDEYRKKYRQNTEELQASNPYHTMT